MDGGHEVPARSSVLDCDSRAVVTGNCTTGAAAAAAAGAAAEADTTADLRRATRRQLDIDH